MSITTTAARVGPPQVGTDSDISPTTHTLAGLLLLRISGFALFQAMIAVAYLILGRDDPWVRAAAWWPYTATAVSIVTLVILRNLLVREGYRYRDLFPFRPDTWRRDATLTLVLTGVSLALGVAPNIALATVLFGDPTTPLDMLLLPLPTWAAAVALLAFPLTVAASELPLYAGYLRPRLESRTGRPSLSVALTSGLLALQHATLPLLFDLRFSTWRALMFAPFALFVIVVARRQPRLLPYLVVVHFIADVGAAAQLLPAAT